MIERFTRDVHHAVFQRFLHPFHGIERIAETRPQEHPPLRAAEFQVKKTLENGVVYVPGEAFYHDKPDTRTLRLSYSTVSEAGLLTAVERLAASL